MTPARCFLLIGTVCLILAGLKNAPVKIQSQLISNASKLTALVSSSTAKHITDAVNSAAFYSSAASIEDILQDEGDELPPFLPTHMMDRQGLTYDVLEYPLHVAVAASDYQEVTELLATDQVGVDDFDPYAISKNGYTPLHLLLKKNRNWLPNDNY